MAAITPRRSSRIPHSHTPKMSERKKALFQGASQPSRESLTEHRKLPVVDSESDSEDCDLGIMGALDSSSDENDNGPRTPERNIWHETRSQTRKLLKENQDLKNFIKSPFTLKKYQSRYCPDAKCTGSVSTPCTPHFHNHPGTPSSTHSCASVHTTSSTSSRARKSLASLIADTESCSSSLKDLNFDTDSGTDSKENTPSKVRRSTRKQKTPQLNFKGVLLEQKKNLLSPMKIAVVCLTKMDMTSVISPTQMLKTPQTTESNQSPPKISHNRRSVVEINESPESYCESDKSHKRVRNDSLTDHGPTSKYPRLENAAPKARLSLFNSDRLKEILSAKSFYGKSNPELNTSITAKISNAIEATSSHPRRPFSHSHSHRRKRRPGQINMGVKHRIRKPKLNKARINLIGNKSFNNTANSSVLNASVVSNVSVNDSSILSQNSSQEIGNEKADPFDKEKQTIEALLSQWTEEEVPEAELRYSKPDVPCFNSTVIQETSQIFEPVTAIPVPTAPTEVPTDSDAVIVELGAKEVAVNQDVVMAESHTADHGDVPKSGQFLPVEGGYILVDDNAEPGLASDEDLTDLDAIERELKMLDEQILQMAQSNNIDPDAVIASTETAVLAVRTPSPSPTEETAKPQKLFPIFSNPNPGTTTPNTKESEKSKRCILKNGSDQYVIDAGQKRFGATQCHECGAIYQIGDPQDEHDHLVHHNATDVIRFNGWKEEFVVFRSETSRCIRVRGTDPGWKRVQALLRRLVHPQLGYEAELRGEPHTYTAYLYIEKKKIVGCLVVEPKLKGYKLIPGDPDCCSVEHYPVKCGVSRVWTHRSARRRGVAARMMDCARASFLYGAALTIADLAFSAPTAAGKAFAASYTGTQNFYVYLD
ncbi:uncharacterized protein LOC128679861 [Plodia interpunctella]|uniref:uncharacterized protein LOC128679861 n=1 Tax=Plodia interpunctella TaxID=58824 RepID=UPI0023686182|nr:uncharacterized protein LOC128679861 [Plodia interpunctella]